MPASRGKGGKGSSGRTTTTQTRTAYKNKGTSDELRLYGTKQKRRPAAKKKK